MRICVSFLIVVCLVACNRGLHNNEAVRKGVIDHLAKIAPKVGLNLESMDVTVSSVQIDGKQADATVTITPKGSPTAQGMSMKYHLEQQGGQWVVTGRQDSGSNPHGGGALPSGPSPHAGGAMEAPPGSPMPSPEDLPPAGKKKE